MLLKPLTDIPKQSSLGSGTGPICSDLRSKSEPRGYFALYRCALAQTIHVDDVFFCLFVLTQKISASNPSTIKTSNFQAYRKTRFVIHGHLAGADLPWIASMCRVWCHHTCT